MNIQANIYLIPTFIDEEALEVLPPYILDAIKKCTVFYVENERTTRRYFKKIYKEMVIDDFEWIAIHKAEASVLKQLETHIAQGKNIGIVSEAGCPAIADPGQLLVRVAQDKNATIHPLVGPSSILLAIMGSGLNGQQFCFNGYLPIDAVERNKKIKDLETTVLQTNTTQIFMETPYRNNALLEAILKNCEPTTLLSIAANLTGKNEYIKTNTIATWKEKSPDLHKQPCIFLLGK
jgi:16S rRNA (cytidine1402-2'-O)-methyltransferase